MSAASAGWAEVAPAKRGQTTRSGLDPPCPDVRTVTASPAWRSRAPRTGDVTTMRRRTAELGRRRRPYPKTFHRPLGYLTGRPTIQPPPLTLDESRRLPGPGPVPRRRLGAGGVEAMNVAGATVP